MVELTAILILRKQSLPASVDKERTQCLSMLLESNRKYLTEKVRKYSQPQEDGDEHLSD